MSFSHTELTGDFNNISPLADLPNDTGGLSSSELKNLFDKAGLDIKQYINETLIPELNKRIYVYKTSGGTESLFSVTISNSQGLPFLLTSDTVVKCEPAVPYFEQFFRSEMKVINIEYTSTSATIELFCSNPVDTAFLFNIVFVN